MAEQSSQEINENNILYKGFLSLVIFFVSFGWLVLFFSAIGLFHAATVVFSLFASLILAYKFTSSDISSEFKLKVGIVVISLLVSFATCYFATPTVFGGRDQGAISSAAINLAKNHQLKFSTPASQDLFKKYGVGKALNFPGFDYTSDGKLISRFPVGYTSYLAASYSLFGLKGIQYANFFPLFLFLVIFWLILKEFFSKKISLTGYLVAATFFPFLWFAKYTLTETYALFLVWAGIFFFIRYLKEKNSRFLVFSLSSLGLSALVRIEGLAFFALALVYVFILRKKNVIRLSNNFYKYLLVFVLLLFIACAILNSHSLLDGFKNIAKSYLPGGGVPNPAGNTYARLFIIFFNYNLLPYIFLGLGGLIAFFAKQKKSWLKPEFPIIFFTFPAFFYLFSPMVTFDDPWMLRRFSFAVFPALIFFTIYFLNRFFVHKIFLYLVLAMLIIVNGAVSWHFLKISESKNLLPQIENISEKFGPDDLVLVDRMASGSGYSLISEPLSSLYGKQAVYFFNAEDLARLNLDRYKNIYLLAPPPNDSDWYSDLVKEKPYEIKKIDNNAVEPSENKFAVAQSVKIETFALIFKIK